MSLNDIAEKAHESTERRGILGKYKTVHALKKATAEKIFEETVEFVYSLPTQDFNKDSEQSEIADIILTLATYSYDCGYDLDKIVSEKLKYNQERKD